MNQFEALELVRLSSIQDFDITTLKAVHSEIKSSIESCEKRALREMLDLMELKAARDYLESKIKERM